MEQTIHLHIDGRKVETSAGLTVLTAAREAGIAIPTLCNLPGAVEPRRPCLLCMVEVEGKGRVRACKSQVADRMVVTTRTPELEAHRRERLEILASTHYGDCTAPCNLTCPGGINVQGYVNLVARGEYEAAFRLIKEKNPLPVSVGRICPRFCETRCRRVLLDEPVAINHLKRFLADYALKHGIKDDVNVLPSGLSVAIIGGGAAGLSAAYYLRKQGHKVTLFEAGEKLGGMLHYGIASYMLPKRILDQEIQGIVNMGVHVRIGNRWGRDFSLKDLLRQGFEAVFVSVGLQHQRPFEVEGGEVALDGLGFLHQVNDGERPDVGRRVLVVGGGSIAVDVARCARRLGAEDVTVIYPRSRVELPAHQREIEEAEKEGVQFFLMAMPLRLLQEGGRIRVEMARTVLGEPDERGVRRPVPMPGSQLFWDGHTVISALGQALDESFQSFGEIEASIKLTSRKTIRANPTTMKTSVSGIFAGGDVVSGSRTVIQAVAAGRRAAFSIHEYLTGERIVQADERFNFSRGKRFEDVDMHNFDGGAIHLRESMPTRPPDRRIADFDEIELGFSEDMARREANRCLQCGCLGLSKCAYRELSIKYGVNTAKAPARLQALIKTDHPFVIVDPNKCVACGRCERSCRYEALELGFDEDASTHTLSDISIRLNERCVSCGACVDACPTGALVKKAAILPMTPDQVELVRSVCTYCGTGCHVNLVVKHGALLEVRNDADRPPNWGELCVKGRFGYTFYRSPDRLRRPLIRESIEESFREASWGEALQLVASSFAGIKDLYGANALGVLSSSRCTNEENYLLQKLARGVWGTNNVDNCARV